MKVPRSATRRFALLTGILVGLAWGVVSQFINILYAPSIPFSHRPFGVVGNAAAMLTAAVVICLLCAVSRSEPVGAALATAAGVLVLEARAFLVGATPVFGLFESAHPVWPLVAILLEIIVLYPLMILIRWAIDIQAEVSTRPLWSWTRVRLPLSLTAIAIALGSASLYSAPTRAAMAQMDGLIRAGLDARGNDLPEPLRSENGVLGFQESATQSYTLEQGQPHYTVSAEWPFEAAEEPVSEPILILARFANGWTLACEFDEDSASPRCRGFAAEYSPPVTDARARI